MVAIPLLILALAAGIYLLMKATREYLSGLYKGLAWLVILLSLAAIAAHVVHGIHHLRHRHGAPMLRHGFMMRDSGPGDMCAMGGCKMVGDSVVLDKAACEKLIGKDSCDKIRAIRGQCIFSKEECMKICNAAGNHCVMGGPPSGSCCMQGGQALNACCAKGGTGAEMKDCCKKK